MITPFDLWMMIITYILGAIAAGVYVDFELRNTELDAEHKHHWAIVIFTAFTWPITWTWMQYKKALTPTPKMHDNKTEDAS